MNVGILKKRIKNVIDEFEAENDCFIVNLKVYQTIIEDEKGKADKLSSTFEIEIE